ncbi:MAG TPA: TetR/AcrR family transcriptional regulator [Thermoanaerobaculia bacterium]|nr:TetR/AcrR family transcriptional regulator [Thermoanaerobaculia bacterium]
MVSEARERYRQELRRTILDAAREAFRAEGYAAVSMRRLAEAAGCTHGNLYVHFRDKEAIFDALVEDAFVQLEEALRVSPKITDPVTRLRRAARAYIDFALANPGAYEFAFILRRPGARHSRPHRAYEHVRTLVQRCIDEKRFRRIDADVASQALWAAVHGITSLFITRDSFPWADRDAIMQRVIDSAVDGLLRDK